MSKFKAFVLGAIAEMNHKVSWPEYSALQRSARLVLIASFIFAVLTGVVDTIFKSLVFWFYRAF